MVLSHNCNKPNRNNSLLGIISIQSLAQLIILINYYFRLIMYQEKDLKLTMLIKINYYERMLLYMKKKCFNNLQIHL